MQRLLSDVQAGSVDVVVVYKVDRLARSLAIHPIWFCCVGAESCRTAAERQNQMPPASIGLWSAFKRSSGAWTIPPIAFPLYAGHGGRVSAPSFEPRLVR